MVSERGSHATAAGLATVAVVLGFALNSMGVEPKAENVAFVRNRKLFPGGEFQRPLTREQAAVVDATFSQAFWDGRLGQAADRAVETSKSRWARGITLLPRCLNPAIAFCESLFNREYPGQARWLWLIYVWTSPIVLTRIDDLLCGPFWTAQSKVIDTAGGISDSNARAYSQSPLTIKRDDLKNVTVWTQKPHERLLGRLEITHRFIGKRILTLLESFDQSRGTGAAMCEIASRAHDDGHASTPRQTLAYRLVNV